MAKCKRCGKQMPFFSMELCNDCTAIAMTEVDDRYQGQARSEISSATSQAANALRPSSGLEASGAGSSDWRVGLTLIGVFVGALVGFLTRPSVFLIGQLPFTAVITRGATLNGMDELLVPAARTSFNHMVLYALLGGGIGLGIAIAMRMKNPGQQGVVTDALRQGIQALTAPPVADAEVLSNDAVLSMIDAGLGEDVVVGKIKYSRCAFALSSSDLANLKQRGASNRIISAMLENQAKRGAAARN